MSSSQNNNNNIGGGVGGKFGKRIFRKSTKTTPYERPPSANRTPNWVSKMVVDPASKLIQFGAKRFFDAVFTTKRITVPPPPEKEQERRNGLQETARDPQINAVVQEPIADVCGTFSSNKDTSGLPELEQLLKNKTFTRSEIDRLTGLLRSRAEDLPVKDDKRGFELNPGLGSGRHQEFPATLTINKMESLGPHGAVPDPAVTSGEQNMQKHFEDRIASPAELAKAYMSRRPEKLSPSSLGLGGQIAYEDSVPPSNPGYTSKSQLSSLPVNTSAYSRVPENGFTTPRSRGRSAIYNMARTPYSRFHPVIHEKVSGSKTYGHSRPPSVASQSALENGGQVASKTMALKRRSSVFDDDIGSIGPIRRIRQKHNLLPHAKSVTISGKGLGSDFNRTARRPFMGNANTGGASTSSASYVHVPRESSMMAAKILEQLEKISPKEKSLESKLATAREGSNFKLTPHMLHGQALRSMEDLDASKLLQNSHKDTKLLDQPVSSFPVSQEFTTQKQVSLEARRSVNSLHSEGKLTLDRIVQGNNNVEKLSPALLSYASQPPEKKRPFKMSAHEDWIEMDDDLCNESELPEKRLEEPMRDSKSAINEDKSLDKSPVPPERTHVLSRTELEEGNVMVGDKNAGFNLSTSLAANTGSQKVLPQSSKEGLSPLLFRSGSPTTANNPISVESGVETSSSLKNVSPGATNAVIGVTDTDASGNKNSELGNTANGNAGKPPSLALNPLVTNNIVSLDAPSSNLASNDGPHASTACLSFSSSAPASVSFTNQSFTNSSSNMASSAGATTSTSALTDCVPVPANGSSSSFSQSVSDNGFSKKLFSPPSTIGSTEVTDVKAGKVNGLGKFSTSSTPLSTFAGTSTGSSIFPFGTSSSSAVTSQWPSSTSGTSAVKESSLAGSGSGNVSLSTPVHFGSSSSATLFGLSGVTPPTSSSIFNSSVPATKSEGTTQSSVSASVTNPVNSVNGAAPVSFKFGDGASASSEGNKFGSTTTASVGAFQFGVNSAIPTSSGSSPSFSFNAGSSASSSAISTGTTAAGVFSFGAGSSSSGTSVSNTTSGVFNFGAATSASSSSANPVTSSSSTAPAIFSFGSNAPAPSTDPNKVSSSGANSGSFASSLQAPKSSFGSAFSMPSSTGFSFGGSLPAFGTSNSSMVFGSTTAVPSNPTFAFSTAASSPLPSSGTQSVFGNSPSPFTATPGNNDQMSAEDCMAEDPIQSSTPAAPAFGQSLVSPQPFVSPSPPGFMFGSTAPSSVAPFQFASQQSQAGQQNPSQFQASGSLEFNAGGSFSLGSSDKSGRKIVKVNRNRNRKMR
ncbi:hypothetical protein LIER_19550 [Lithospermum erythrorhizon]|uniref:Nuclear pore complex protein n=1 Tax=Lithospermum erythrorhizon TaxID=34254 RepID=A0AAV3QI31_LITER